jgi:hypothetical protein
MKTQSTFYAFLILFFFLACAENEDIDTPKTDDGIQERIAAVVSPQNQDIFKDLGLNINSGTNPPNIAGHYRIKNKTLQATTQSGGNQTGHVFPDAGIRFFDQVSENVKIQGVRLIGEELTANNAIITGSGNNFSVFAKGTARNGSNAAVFDIIISGTKDGNNLRNLKIAYINTNNSSGGNTFVPQGTAQLVTDGGSVSEAIESISEVLESGPVDDDNDEPSGSEGVYVAGYQRSRVTNLNIATIWKDGVITTLDNEGKSGIATGITYMGEDMIIPGHLRSTVTSADAEAVYWKNEDLIKLDNNGQASEALAVFVEGNDLYFAGTVNNKAAIWKNGTVQELPTRGTRSEAMGIFVDNGTVYAVGREVVSGRFVGVLWRDGEPTYLSEGSRNVHLYGVGVLNGSVYVSGAENHPDTGPADANRLYARFWKDGEAEWLMEGPRLSYSRAVKIHNGHVFLIYDEVADGFGNNNLFVMKDGEQQQIFSGKPAQAAAIEVKGNDVYVAGYISYEAAYVKNGTEVILPKSEPRIDYGQTGAYGIYVK